MKKMMMLAGAVALAACAQAATVSWSCTKVYTGDTENKAAGVAYFLTTSMASVDSWASLKSASEFNTALSGKYSFTPATAGTYTHDAVENATLGLADATDYTAYLLVFDTATITDSSKYYITSTAALTTMGGTSTKALTFGSQKDASQAAAGWTTVSTPEPTSGLLLLLGLAGVALKRKRA